MRALSIQQPWSWLIVNGHKDIENRDWTTNYRGLILIHAGKRIDPNVFYEFNNTFGAIPFGLEDRSFVDRMPLRNEYELGGIVGYATLTKVITASTNPWFRGRYGFVLIGQHTVPFIPLRGQLGLFEVSAEIIEQVLLKAAERNDDDLENLLQVAIEEMDEARATRLLDKVHQVLSEDVRDLRGWR